jgi:hypothetical protein
MILINFLGGGIVEAVVDLFIIALWLIPLFFTIKNLVAYLTAPIPTFGAEARAALIKSTVFTVVFILLSIGFNLFLRPLLF